jgi:hypothetical protein
MLLEIDAFVLISGLLYRQLLKASTPKKVVISRLSGVPMVKELPPLAASIVGPAAFFLNSDVAVLTVSKCRAEPCPQNAIITSVGTLYEFMQCTNHLACARAYFER